MRLKKNSANESFEVELSGGEKLPQGPRKWWKQMKRIIWQRRQQINNTTTVLLPKSVRKGRLFDKFGSLFAILLRRMFIKVMKVFSPGLSRSFIIHHWRRKSEDLHARKKKLVMSEPKLTRVLKYLHDDTTSSLQFPARFCAMIRCWMKFICKAEKGFSIKQPNVSDFTWGNFI